MEKYSVMIYNFVDKTWDVMNLANKWKGRYTATKLTKEDAKMCKFMADNFSGGGVKTKCFKETS